MVPRAGIFPAELTALRGVGLLIAAFLVVYAVARRRTLRNADVLILILAGLGLALVKHILNRHQGRLTIESKEGEGATFTVRLQSSSIPALR